MAERSTDREVEQRVFDLYDDYCHGRIERRDFRTIAFFKKHLA